MKKSALYKYYCETEPKMLENIRKDKAVNGYKVTSRRMFAAEVNIMTDVLKHLNQKGITVLYVYDALLCEQKDRAVVAEAMNRIILEHGVKTSVKMEAVTVPQPTSPKYRLNDEVNLYELLPALSFSVPESMAIINSLNSSKVLMRELASYIGYLRKQQVYKDYQGCHNTRENKPFKSLCGFININLTER